MLLLSPISICSSKICHTNYSPNNNQMDKLSLHIFWLIPFYAILLNGSSVHAILIKFTNISCDTKFPNLATVEYCHIGQIDQLKNFMSVRLKLAAPIPSDLFFNFKLMIRSNGWKPFLYDFEVDMCRFWKTRYNALAKLVFGFLDGHTNLNHSCPYRDKYMSIDRILNTDVSKRMPHLPLGKGHYGIFTRWSWSNLTRTTCNIFIEVVND